jgi:hypothetical protein
MLRHLVRRRRIGLIVMDPLNGYLDASEIDVNKEQEVRQALKPVRDFAEGAGVTIIGLRHLNKASDKPAMYRGGGSIALTAVARSTLLVARHPDDPALRVVVVQKCNLVPDLAKRPIGFRIGQDGQGRPRGPGELPRDLGMWVLELVAELEPAAERIERRNALLRYAAGRLPGSRMARAGRLEEEIGSLLVSSRLRTHAAEPDDGVRDLVARALEADPDMPRSRRQLFRLLRPDWS